MIVISKFHPGADVRNGRKYATFPSLVLQPEETENKKTVLEYILQP